MRVFIKILQSQESGYSGDLPNQRGKYILPPINSWNFFPQLSQGVRNSFATLRIRLPNQSWIGVFYVWNNTKYFPEAGLMKKHNERRIYRNNSLDEGLGLDRYVIVFFGKSDDSDGFYSFSLKPTDPEYQNVLNFLGSRKSLIVDLELLKTIAPSVSDALSIESSTPDTLADESKSIVNISELLGEAREHIKPNDAQQAALEINGDPYAALLSTIKTQADFSEAVRSVYGGKCALRNSFIYRNYPIGLEAAHIHPKSSGGVNLPTNGILLSNDLHRAFDEGVWTLDDDLRVMLHENISDGLMMEFNGIRLNIPSRNLALQPFLGYVRWHRENVFGRFTRLV